MTKELNFEVGKFYVNGNGKKWECLKTGLDNEYSIALTNGRIVKTFTKEGHLYMDEPNSTYNIVGEWVEKPVVDWSVMPTWAKFVAMDRNSNWYWYDKKPTKDCFKWNNMCQAGIIPSSYAPKFNGDWTESLIERP